MRELLVVLAVILMTLVAGLTAWGASVGASEAGVHQFASPSAPLSASPSTSVSVGVRVGVPNERMLEVVVDGAGTTTIVRVLSNANPGDTPVLYCRWKDTGAPCVVTQEMRDQLRGLTLRAGYGVVYP